MMATQITREPVWSVQMNHPQAVQSANSIFVLDSLHAAQATSLQSGVIFADATFASATMAALADAKSRLLRVHGVKEVRPTIEDGVISLFILASGLLPDDIDEISEIQWQTMDAYPACILDVRVHDDMDRT